MKIDLNELRRLVGDAVAEAKRKKKKKKGKVEEPVKGYEHADALDFSEPLGEDNLYRIQGAAAWGPQTGVGPDLSELLKSLKTESVVRALVETLLREELEQTAFEAVQSMGPWESAELAYDAGLSLVEKRIGFKKLKGKLARQGAGNPAGLAAAIGRKKYGKKAFQAKAAAGRRKG